MAKFGPAGMAGVGLMADFRGGGNGPRRGWNRRLGAGRRVFLGAFGLWKGFLGLPRIARGSVIGVGSLEAGGADNNF